MAVYLCGILVLYPFLSHLKSKCILIKAAGSNFLPTALEQSKYQIGSVEGSKPRCRCSITQANWDSVVASLPQFFCLAIKWEMVMLCRCAPARPAQVARAVWRSGKVLGGFVVNWECDENVSWASLLTFGDSARVPPCPSVHAAVTWGPLASSFSSAAGFRWSMLRAARFSSSKNYFTDHSRFW